MRLPMDQQRNARNRPPISHLELTEIHSMKQQPQAPRTLTNLSPPLREVRQYLNRYTRSVWRVAQLTQRTLRNLVSGGLAKTLQATQTVARAVLVC